MRKLKFLLLLWVLLWGSWLPTLNPSFATEGSNAHDLLEQAFNPAIQANSVIGGGDIGTTKDQVGSYVLREGNEISLSLDKWLEKKRRPSLLVQFSKFLLRLTIILSITMVTSKGENPKEIYSNILYIVFGILLGLSSVIIIRLVSSIWQTTLTGIS